MVKQHCRARWCKPGEGPKKFGELISADHIVSKSEDSRGFDGSRYALVFLDQGTPWVDVAPTATKTTEETTRALQDFVGPSERVENFYSDNAGELVKAARSLGWRSDQSVPYVSQTNGRIERAIRLVEEGTRTLLEHSGLAPEAWPRKHGHREGRGALPVESERVGADAQALLANQRLEDSVKAACGADARGAPSADALAGHANGLGEGRGALRELAAMARLAALAGEARAAAKHSWTARAQATFNIERLCSVRAVVNNAINFSRPMFLIFLKNDFNILWIFSFLLVPE